MMAALGQAYGDALELSALLALGSAWGIKIAVVADGGGRWFWK